MKLIVGLGNIGSKYKKTRHNIGFRILDSWSNLDKDNWSIKSKLSGAILETIWNNEKIIFLKPTTMMNLSGQAVQKTTNFYKIKPENILVISDDWSLLIGEIRLRDQGSYGGHNGLRDIIAQLETEEFARLRIGIRPVNIDETTDPMNFVLQDFDKKDEKKITQEVIPMAITKIEEWIKTA